MVALYDFIELVKNKPLISSVETLIQLALPLSLHPLRFDFTSVYSLD